MSQTDATNDTETRLIHPPGVLTTQIPITTAINDLETLLIHARPAVTEFIRRREADLLHSPHPPATRQLIEQETQQMHEVLLRIDEIVAGRA